MTPPEPSSLATVGSGVAQSTERFSGTAGITAEVTRWSARQAREVLARVADPGPERDQRDDGADDPVRPPGEQRGDDAGEAGRDQRRLPGGRREVDELGRLAVAAVVGHQPM